MSTEAMTPTAPRDHRPPADAVFTTWTIYARPADYPNGYVLRASHVLDSGDIVPDDRAWYAANPHVLREMMPLGFYNIGRFANDDPCILETWV